MTTLQVPSVHELRQTFATTPSRYTVSAKPTSSQIKRLRKVLSSNLKKITCILPGADTTGWKWILLDATEWQELMIAQRGILVQDAAALASLPPLPSSTNPGLFEMEDAWTDKRALREKERYTQTLYHYQYKSNLEQACLLDLSEVIPLPLIADLQDDDGKLLNTRCTALIRLFEQSVPCINAPDSILSRSGVFLHGILHL